MKKLITFAGLLLLLGCHKMAKVDQFNLTLGEKGVATSSNTTGETPTPNAQNSASSDCLPSDEGSVGKEVVFGGKIPSQQELLSFMRQFNDNFVQKDPCIPIAGQVPAGVPSPVADAPKKNDPPKEAADALKEGAQDLVNRGDAEEVEEEVEEEAPFSPAARAHVEKAVPVYVTRMELTLTLGEGTNAVGPVFFDYMESPTVMEPVDDRLPPEQSFELDPSLAHLDDPVFAEGRYHFSLNLPEADRLDSMEYFRIRNMTSAADDGLDRFLLRGIELRLFNGEALVEQVVIESGNLKVNVSRNLLLAFARTESLRTKLLRHPASRADQFVLVFSTGESGFEGDFNLSIGGENGSPATQWMNIRNPFGFRRNTTSVLYLCGRDDPQASCHFPENGLRSFAYPSEVGPIEAVFDRSATDWDLRSFSVTARFHSGEYTTICHKESPKFVWGGFVLSCRPSYIIDLYQP